MVRADSSVRGPFLERGFLEHYHVVPFADGRATDSRQTRVALLRTTPKTRSGGWGRRKEMRDRGRTFWRNRWTGV